MGCLYPVTCLFYLQSVSSFYHDEEAGGQGLTGRVFQLRVGSGSGIGKNYRVGSGSGSGIGNIQGVFFHWASPKKTKSKIVLEYPDWASPGPHKKVKVHGLGLP